MEIADDDSNTERLIELSLSLPSVKVITDDNIADFVEDNGGYWEKNVTPKLCKSSISAKFITSKLGKRPISAEFITSKLWKSHFWHDFTHKN